MQRRTTALSVSRTVGLPPTPEDIKSPSPLEFLTLGWGGSPHSANPKELWERKN